MKLEIAQLCHIMPKLSPGLAGAYLAPLNSAMEEFEIAAEAARVAAFLAQLAHESNQLRWWEEIWGPTDYQIKYEGRTDLGNIVEGDGYRFRGRGPIQLTGRKNYRTAGAALDVDFENHPDLAKEPEHGFRVAGWFWKTHGLNEIADRGDFLAITKRINGGTNGLVDRLAHWDVAKRELGVVYASEIG